MKIAIICHFSNQEIQNKIKPWKKVNEFAPWISFYIEEFKKYSEHEFYIISPHEWLFKDVHYSDKNIHYYFFRWGMPIIGRNWPIINLDFITRYWLNKLKIKQNVKKMKPDIINLIGFENPYYSSAILQFNNKCPILISIQGFYGRSLLPARLNNYEKFRLSLENTIMKQFKHFNIRTDDMLDYALKQNQNLKEYRFDFPSNYGKIKTPEKNKEYDFVFFARVSKDKGIYDFLEAINYIKQTRKKVTAIIVGLCTKAMQEFIDTYCKENRLSNNIKLVGFVKTQKELFEKVKTAKISVLPTYNDIIAGTIIESMFLKIPVITYHTGSIPEVNKNRENIMICEQGNKEELQKRMLELLENNGKQEELAMNGYEWVLNRFDNHSAMKCYFESLSIIIKDFAEKKNRREN